ncbi:hypothetical protein VOLCADRAFT_87775 [Volvox carteri f. nagariensis]|uniref:Orn/Lys/Arg decarboxylases family 1 pyridoxal-P attachment site domain-containing protein n=1 Tax=Volvox carteri f. nagariensis TaxID=3068 RepID=D8TM75_VOLCA|nr:uncharacterized protein VOLCADRAFT_87775 [Volvox carteri f. nagariensis]EFJ51454.1 hypothetical protein VOLCADRAFT_87775 [Volvox carteri f. nagariensis]|eukprot:XP_002947406.1 hypothetical protein VOLCADRAFT_87775 [Volvox carteri f. nagariensis]
MHSTCRDLFNNRQQRGDAVHEAPFHVPGHKYDLTEISGLDYLSSPSGVIMEAQQLAAEAFGADRTWFLVNGCCEPYWLQPEVDPVFGVAHCVTHGSVREALRVATAGDNGDDDLDDEEAAAAMAAQGRRRQRRRGRGRLVAGVLIVSPTYFGSVADVEGDCGADLVIQSTHKVLGAMTQAAMLHGAGPRVCPTRVSRALQTLQSSSPSYLLMASLDAARAQAAAGRGVAFDEPCAAAQVIRAAVSRCKRIRLLDERTAGSRASVRYFDPLRLTLLVTGLELQGGGFGAAEWLETQHGVVPELATAKTVVLALGPGTTLAHADAAAAALLELDEWTQKVAAEEAEEEAESSVTTSKKKNDAADSTLEVEVEVALTPREAFFAASESLTAAEAVGRISAELLCPYPPGVPVLFPGERITDLALEVLSSTLAGGGAVTGARDGTLETIQVVVVA